MRISSGPPPFASKRRAPFEQRRGHCDVLHTRSGKQDLQAVAKKLASNDPTVYQSAVQSVARSSTLMKMLRSAVSAPIAGAMQAYRQQAVQPQVTRGR